MSELKQKKAGALKVAPGKADHSVKTNRMQTGRLKLLITVVNRGKADYFVDLIQSFDVNMQLVCLAMGTASAQMISLLGLEDRSRSVIFSIVREDKAQDIMDALEEKFRTIKNGKGVAYTVPLSSMIGVAAYGFLSNDPRTLKEEKK